MKIAALALRGTTQWPGLQAGALDAGLNVFHGPPASGKTALADLIGHALCGRRIPAADGVQLQPPEGELVVECEGRRFRLRRKADPTSAGRLTVAGLDGVVGVDRDTVHRLTYGVSPSLLAPLYVLNFREPLRLEWLLSERFAQEFRTFFPRRRWHGNRPASSFLAQLTHGDLLRLRITHPKRRTVVVHRAGRVLPVESLAPIERDSVYLSLCFALVSAFRRQGIELPLVLDEPFVRLDRRATVALIETLCELGRNGQQALVFTARQEAAERFAELGATMHDMTRLREPNEEPTLAVVAEAKTQAETSTHKRKRRRAG